MDYTKTVDELRHCASVHDCTGCGYGCDTHSLPRNRDLLNDAADAIEELVAAVPKWISVEERLPNDDTHVLIWDGERVRFCYVVTDIVFCAYAEKENITHWMPLPDPPKEVE